MIWEVMATVAAAAQQEEMTARQALVNQYTALSLARHKTAWKAERARIQRLHDARYAMRRTNYEFSAASGGFEGQPWKTEGSMEVCEKDGWRLQMHEIEGDFLACIIPPGGMSKWYTGDHSLIGLPAVK